MLQSRDSPKQGTVHTVVFLLSVILFTNIYGKCKTFGLTCAQREENFEMVRKVMFSFTAHYLNGKKPAEQMGFGTETMVAKQPVVVAGPKHSFFKLPSKSPKPHTAGNYLHIYVFNNRHVLLVNC